MIQARYDNGSSQRDLIKEYGINWKSFTMAIKRGDFKPRATAEAVTLARKQGKGFCEHTEEFKKSVSIRQSLNNSGGRCKWFDVHGQRVQGTWERDGGLKLTELGIEWRKCGWRDDIIEYILDGKKRRYTPDFYLPAYDLYLEFKGYWWGDDRRKMDAVMAQNPAKEILIIEKDAFKAMMILQKSADIIMLGI